MLGRVRAGGDDGVAFGGNARTLLLLKSLSLLWMAKMESLHDMYLSLPIATQSSPKPHREILPSSAHTSYHQVAKSLVQAFKLTR